MTVSGCDHGNWRHAPTDKERDLLLFIRGYRRRHGYPPTMREMAIAIGWASTTSVVVHLNKLQELGYITRQRHQARSIRILKIPGA